MPVIVNDLEVVTETQATPQAAPQATGGEPDRSGDAAVPVLGPEDVAEWLRHEAERAARLSDR